MSWTSPTSCRPHDQDYQMFCGEAVEMMILANQGVPLASLDQTRLVALRKRRSSFFTDPADLRDLLQLYLPTHRFGVQLRAAQGDAMRDMVFALKTTKVPVATLVQGGLHWTVVSAVQTDVDPVPGQAYIVQRVYCNNPRIAVSPHPHSDADACAGTALNGVPAATVQSYDNWCEMFVSGVVAGGSQYIQVTDSPAAHQAPPPVNGSPAPNNPLTPDIEVPSSPVPQAARPVAQADLEEESREAFMSMQLPGDPPKSVAEILQGAQVGAAVRVERLDQGGRDYFLVPWLVAGRLVATVQIDAASGRFASAHFHGQPWHSEFLAADTQPTRQWLTQQGIDAGHAPVEPLKLVWQPCLESFSPHFPFVQLATGPGPGAVAAPPPAVAGPGASQKVFVRLDGNVFPSLTGLPK